MEYTVIFHEAEEGGYWVDVPALPGCYSQGETIEESMKNVEEAIELHLEGMKEEHLKVPKDSGFVVGRVAIPV
ncbi:MAG: type II toxin-antitoxin system HicB family antitoxin [Candidatus Omnitrophota bacterium]